MRTHIHYINKCIELGNNAMLNGNPPVGSILVKDDTIIGTGIEAGKSGNDITKHAEIEAIRDALIENQSLENSFLYTTHEPCIMCSYVIRHHQIKTIVFGIKSKYVGGASSEFKILETESVPSWKEIPEIIEGILENECLALSKLQSN
ncbi:nucleoside deaminase [Arenibacter sp. TNZ]|uniref:nucleoside deaminase n=1 Tax=Arenibacter TaxID=178469 RepID=UPI000CD4771F|nr:MULTISPECIES: nucleoside deaminase [Arenibacter]MCM4170538.1 nucleoside deaminase [Arenibacter sp. TNZ]